MRFRLVVLAICCLTLPGLALAEIVTIRSGEHDDFSRLVLAVPVGTQWQLEPTQTGYTLDLVGPVSGFDVSGVFDRIPRDRLANIAPGPVSGQLDLQFDCDCHAEGFLWRDDRLVIDIIDGPAPAAAVFGQAGMQVADPITTTPRTLPLLVERTPRDETSGIPGTFVPDGLQSPVAEPGADRVAAAEAAIIESFSRAAAQGLIDIAPQAVLPASDPVVGHFETEAPDHATASQAPADDVPPAAAALDAASDHEVSTSGATAQPGLTARTSFDRDRAEITPDPARRCLEDRHFDVAAWGDNRDFSDQIADRRLLLTTETGALRAGAIDALARSYLHFGFGQEALQVLELDGNRSQERLILAAMARAVDALPVSETILLGQPGCDGPVSLWRSLARDSLDGTDIAERRAVVAAYRDLPDTLRGQLGPRLAGMLIAVGDPEMAETVLNAAIHGIAVDTSAAEVVAANITFEVEGADAAMSQLSGLAQSDPRLGPEGIVRLIDLSLSSGGSLPEDLLLLAGSLRFEHRGTPAAAALARAEILGLIANDRFAEAFALIDVDAATASGPDGLDHRELRSLAASRLAQRLPDMEFLAMVFADLPQDLEPSAVNEIAARLISLGFAERAAALLSGPAVRDALAERRYLRAEAALALGDYAGFERALVGMSDPRSEALRAGMGTPPPRREVQVAAQEPLTTASSDVQGAWRSGAWAQLEQGDDPLLRAAAAAALAPSIVMGEVSPLADRAAVLADSRQTREMLAELLERFPIDPEQSPQD